MKRILLAFVIVSVSGCSKNSRTTLSSDSAKKYAEITSVSAEDAANLARMDTLDFDIFNNRKWNAFAGYHNDSVFVKFANGEMSESDSNHIKYLRALCDEIPDLKIENHETKFASGGWTCVTGMLSGTFTKAMLSPAGDTVQPTGKNFVIPFCTIALWKEKRIAQKMMYWDNNLMMKQIGVIK